MVVVTGTGDGDRTMAARHRVRPDLLAATTNKGDGSPARVGGGGRGVAAGQPGELVSLRPPTARPWGLTSGCCPLPTSSPAGIGRGVSNEWVEEVATVRVPPASCSQSPGPPEGGRAPGTSLRPRLGGPGRGATIAPWT